MNILFLVTDQLSHSALSCADNPHVHTPNMDRLAASGTRFTNAYCASPVCGPSRASLATGRLPHEHGVLYNGGSIPDEMSSMGDVFRAADYRTAWAGRWCVPGNGPDIRGFDCLHSLDQPLGQGILADHHVADCAIDFLGQAHDQPFLLGVSLCNPHGICYWVMQQSTPQGQLNQHTVGLKRAADALDFGSLSEATLPPLPTNHPVDPDEPGSLSRCRERRYYGQEGIFTWDWTVETWRRYLNAYYRLTELVDVQVGRVMTALQESGQAEDTLVVLTSDHGEGMAAHKWVTKLSLHEEPAHVPLLLSHPGKVEAATTSNVLASGIDVLPTMCDYAGIECHDVTGVSLRSLLGGSESRDHVVSELHPDPKDQTFQGRMVRTEKYKYITYSEGENPEQLFDLSTDPGESQNLAKDTQYGSVLDQHRELLVKSCETTHDTWIR